MSTDELKLKTVLVLGGSYGGSRAAQVLAAGLPNGWRVVLVDRNSHFNHVYNLPRYAVLPGHEHKAFIPYDKLFNLSDSALSHPHQCVHGTITSLHPHHITYTPHDATSGDAALTPLESPPIEATEERVLQFDYAVYALGSHLPSPIDLWGSRDMHYSSKDARPYTGTKPEGISWLRSRQQRIEAARRVLVVGGGALGIQFASDIAAIYPHTSVTLLHSRSRLLPRFDEALGDEVYHGLQELGVHVVFGERLDMASLNGAITKGHGNQETVSVKTVGGREIETDLVLLCTGQIPNTSLLHAMDARTTDPKSGMVRVSRTMQIVALREQDPTVDEDSLESSVVRSTSPTVCGTTPPSPVDTLVELDMTPPEAMSLSPSTKDVFAESEVDAFYDPHTFAYPHLFAIGDAADAFGAHKAGHTAYYQAEVAARNVIRLIKGAEKIRGGAKDDSEDLELEEYVPGLPMIKVSLGLTRSAYEVAGVVGIKDDGTDDLGATVVWGAFGYKDIDEAVRWQ